MLVFDIGWLGELTKRFAMPGDVVSIHPHGNGHINDTFLVTLDQGGQSVRYILQHVNEEVFVRPELVMENVQRVTEYLQTRIEAEHTGQPSRHCLTLVPSRDGDVFIRDDAGRVWRMYVYIEDADSHEVIPSLDVAFEAARAFGTFQRLMADLPGSRLHETIPGFHYTPARLDAFRTAVREDRVGRVGMLSDEIQFAEEQSALATVLCDAVDRGDLPERIVHNDTKINNVMIDRNSGEGLCVIDLDTVMPGLVAHDYGDMIRAAANTAEEDDRDLSKVGLDLDIFQALTNGFLESAASFLTPAEVDHLAISPNVMAYELGLRFLTDFLNGDVYFKVSHVMHNLERGRNQFQLLRSMIEHETYMSDCVHEVLRKSTAS